MAEGIALGDAKDMNEAKKIVSDNKKRLKRVIEYNKLKVSPSSFKFKIEKQEKPNWMDKWEYPYYVYVYVPSKQYSWIFLS